MNLITTLLGATGLLLVVAVALSVMKMGKGDEQAEIKKLRAELDLLNAQQSQLTPMPSPPAPIPLSPEGLVSSGGTASPTGADPDLPEPTSTPQGAEANSEDLPSGPITAANPTAGESAPTRAQLEEELAKAEQENELLKQEAREGLISKSMIESAKKQKARASTVKQAWLQAKVIEWVAKQPDQQSGGFAIIELHRDMPPGTVLAIRRQSGIYGRLMVDHIYKDKNQASANPVRGTFPDGESPEINPGDELIIAPFGS
ncbi:MAG: hypothetical protein P8M65_05780 [Roseibacillus sp.]|jgi:hypothetical protein|nr:hypothetical protein [Roseibacillus sp.]